PSHHKKRPASHIPRPPNAFILFRANFIRDRRVNVPSTGPLSNVSPTTLSTIVGMTWRSLPEAEREVWVEKARIAREEHKLQYPSYRYQPAPTPDEKAK
ncbi:HMG-box, partial [Sistotremastrum suecicum HHB10207 ss-3]